MKRLFTLLATCCFLQSFGQIEIGINGGILANRTPWVGARPSTYTQSATISGYTSLKLLTHVRNNWQVGLGIDIATITSKLTIEVSQTPPVQRYGTVQIGDPNIPLYLMLNRTFKAPGGYLYGGMNVGLTFITDAGKNTYSTRYIANTESHGFQTGLQFGYTGKLINRLGVNVELGVRYMTTGVPAAQKNVDATYDIWYFPASVGLRYWL